MADSAYDLAVRLSLETSGLASAATSAMRAFGQIESRAGAADAAMARLNQRAAMQGMTAAQRQAHLYTQALNEQTTAHANLATAMGGVTKMAVGAGLVGIGLVGVNLMKGWVSAASELQSAMAGVGLATVATAGKIGELDTLKNMTFEVAAKTRFSAPDIANIEKLAATSGLNKRSDLIGALPTLGNAAEVALQMKGVGYQESVPAFVQMAHLFQSYGGKKFNSLLDLAGRASVVSGDTPSSLENTLQYIMPAVNAYKLTPEDAISVSALASNVGLSGGHGGGSRIQAMFRGIAPLLSSRGAMHNKALDQIQSLGGHRFFKGGNFEDAGGVTNLLTTVMTAMEHIPDQARRMSLLNAAFGAAGGTALSSLATPGAVTRFQAIQGDLAPNGGIASTSVMQQVFNSTMAGQTATLTTNMSSLSAILGTQLLPLLTPIVHGIVQVTGALVAFLSHHQQIAQFVALFTLAATTVALVAGPILVAAGAMTIMSASASTLAASGVGLQAAFWPVTLTVLGIAAAVAAVVIVFNNWGTITGALSGHLGPLWQAISIGALAITGLVLASGSLGAVGAAIVGLSVAAVTAIPGFAGLDVVMSPILITVIAIAAAVGAVILVFKNWHTITTLVGNLLGWFGGKIHDLLVLLGLIHDTPAAKPNAFVAGAPTTPTGATPPTPTHDPRHGHYVMAGRTQVWVPDASGGGASPEHWIPSQYAGRPAGGVPGHVLAMTPALTMLPRLPETLSLPAARPTPAHAPVRRAPAPATHTHGATSINFHPGAIVVHGAQGQDVAALAKLVAGEVEETIGRKTREGEMYQATQFMGLLLPIVPLG